LHASIVDWTSQRNSLAVLKAVEFHQLLSNDSSLAIVDKGLPLGLGHFQFRHHFSKLARIDGKVRKEVPFVFVDTSKPADRNYGRHHGHGSYPLCMGDRQCEPERHGMTSD